ncbi:MAG: SCO family protein [Leptospiraceae bacterium]|nr:SCO family protein [Leptospiraceae bacterium]MCP5496449.1 SCO family protein [Leptospiraceae bacterium]
MKIFIIVLIVLSQFYCKGRDLPFHNYTIGGDFTLTNQDNQKFSLKELEGKVVFLYFGYTFCPDACPLTLSKLNIVFQNLKDKTNLMNVVFITIDPERDTAERLKNYLKYYSYLKPIGLTGTTEEIAKIAKQYNAIYQKAQSKSKAGYLVDHSTYTYLIDTHGKVKYLFRHDESVEVITKITKLLFDTEQIK